jgi:flagellar biogenesis protein FliO
VARRNLLERTSSVYDRWQPVQSIRKRATHLLFFTLTLLIVILLFSLGLWWVVWRVTSS